MKITRSNLDRTNSTYEIEALSLYEAAQKNGKLSGEELSQLCFLVAHIFGRLQGIPDSNEYGESLPPQRYISEETQSNTSP